MGCGLLDPQLWRSPGGAGGTGQGTEEEDSPGRRRQMLCGLLQGRPREGPPPAVLTRRGSPELKASGRSWAPGSQTLMGPMAEASWY